MRMLQACDSTRLPCKSAAHIAVAGVVIMNDLNRHTPTEGRTLTAFIYCTHTPYADGSDNIIVTKLLPFQRQHPVHSSFHGSAVCSGTTPLPTMGVVVSNWQETQ